MKLMRNLKGASLLVAVLIAVVASAFTVPTKHHAFTGTTYFGQTSGTQVVTSGKLNSTVTLDVSSSWVSITSEVNLAGGPTDFATAFCPAPTSQTCFVGGTEKSSSPLKIKIIVLHQGTLTL
jgi:hypothetical protein